MQHNPTATLWLFAYSGITGGTYLSLIRDARDWPNLTHCVIADDALISRSRSRAASRFLQADRREAGDVLLMVDHDIAWQEGDLSHIARRALERGALVGGIYPKRAFGQASAVRFDAQGEFTIGSEDMIPARYLGSGFLAIPRTALEAVAATLPTVQLDRAYWPLFLPMLTDQPDTEYLSEDYAFCWRARQAGFESYAACRPRLTHEGTYTYRLVDAKARPPVDADVTITLASSADLTAARR